MLGTFSCGYELKEIPDVSPIISAFDAMEPSDPEDDESEVIVLLFRVISAVSYCDEEDFAAIRILLELLINSLLDIWYVEVAVD